MNASSGQRQGPWGNPVANVLVMIVGALIVGVSIVVGFVAFVALAALFLVLGAFMGVRLWWLQRKLRRNGTGQPGRPTDTGQSPQVIEGEFRVVSSSKPDRD